MTKQTREQAREIQRRVRNAVREAVSARRIQSSAGSITEKATDEILFRGSHDITQALAPYPTSVAYALVPSVVRFMLQSFLEIDAAEIPVEGGLGWLRQPRTSTPYRRGSAATSTTSRRAAIRRMTCRGLRARRTRSAPYRQRWKN